MTKHVHCGSFFAGNENTEHKNWTLVVGDDGVIAYAGPATAAPLPGPNATVVDYSGLFVMPGLLDVHTHLAYGNAKTEEDIDLYSPLEFRALRGMFFAQKCAAAGFTSNGVLYLRAESRLIAMDLRVKKGDVPPAVGKGKELEGGDHEP